MTGKDQFLNSVYQVASKGGLGFELQLSGLLQLGCDRFGMDIGVVCRIDKDVFTILASYETNTHFFTPGAQTPIHESACEVIVRNEALTIVEPGSEYMQRLTKASVNAGAYIGIPVCVDGQMIGTLCFIGLDHRETPVPQVDENELGILSLILTGLIERKLHIETEHELSQMASVVECSHDAIFTETLDRIILTWNPAAERMFGYTADDIIGKSANMVYPNNGGKRAEKLMEKVVRGERTDSVEVVNVRKDGSLVNTSFTLSPVRDKSGKVIAASVMVRNIDERVRAQQALAKSEERYALAAQGSNDGLWDWDLQTNEVYYASRWKSILGYASMEIIPLIESWTDRIHPADVTQFNADLALHLSGKTDNLDNEHRIITYNGEERWVMCRGVAVRDEQGRPTRIAGSVSDITKRKLAEAALIQQAQQDKLTALPNRAYFLEIVRTALARSKRNKQYKFALLFLDFDRFKVINDSLGHEYGDMLLVNIAQILRVQMRTVDTAARLGGDEFVILLDGINGLEDAIVVAERLLDTFSKSHNLGGHEVTSTASIGIVTSEGDYDKPDELIRDADTAMYQAKAEGKARYVIFDEQMYAKALHRLNLEKELRKAIALGQMWLAYQPIVSLESGRLCGFEALLRWDHPEMGSVSPASFIEIAEETGDIVAIGEWVLRQACIQLAKWKQEHPAAADLYMNINVSKRQLTQPEVVKKLDRVFQSTGVKPDDVTLEITECVIMDDRHEITPVLNDIRSLGVRLAMDDFGTGHSSLSCLHRFPINILKIDRDFIGNLEQRLEFTAVVQAIVMLAHTLGISVVAEGPENAEQVAQLQTLECDCAQGYFFSKPMKADVAGRFISASQNPRLSA